MTNNVYFTDNGHMVSVPIQTQDSYSLLLIFPGIPLIVVIGFVMKCHKIYVVNML